MKAIYRRELVTIVAWNAARTKAKAHRPHIPAWSRAKMRARQRAKHQIYYHAHKLNQRRRWLESLRGAP